MAGRIVEMPGLNANSGQIWLVVESVDMRRGIDGSASVFCNRDGNRIKVLLWDSTDVWLC